MPIGKLMARNSARDGTRPLWVSRPRGGGPHERRGPPPRRAGRGLSAHDGLFTGRSVIPRGISRPKTCAYDERQTPPTHVHQGRSRREHARRQRPGSDRRRNLFCGTPDQGLDQIASFAILRRDGQSPVDDGSCRIPDGPRRPSTISRYSRRTFCRGSRPGSSPTLMKWLPWRRPNR